MSTSHRCFVTFFIGCQSLQGYSSRLLLWPSTVSESESSLPQASNLTGFRIVTSVTPFDWSQRPVRFAGKHVHRPAKFLHRGSCRLERTPPDLRSPLNSRRQFRSKLKLIFSDKPTTLHDFSENSCLRMKLCNCNCNYKLPNIDTVLFMYCNYSKHNADSLWLLYCVSLSCVETLALV